MQAFKISEGSIVADRLIIAIQSEKQYLSDIDGAIGDGDHGINMNKGFTMCREALDREPGDLAHSFRTLSKILMMKIGGSMGPLYGKFFSALARSYEGKTEIGKEDFLASLEAVMEELGKISSARPGDKTLIDTLSPAVNAFRKALDEGGSFSEALDMMTEAARSGRDSTKDMVARIGRASRLGERSRGVIDAGAASCCIILESMASSIKLLL
ncbi:MAG: dihydroxyacetone kinase subunit DhaL [Bacteroidales bacterium]|jgi:dihydroxyacetone kinase-like protein|nr:dihydroxyacetone kinase subunit DhaL [Bacteroidales bacterium]